MCFGNYLPTFSLGPQQETDCSGLHFHAPHILSLCVHTSVFYICITFCSMGHFALCLFAFIIAYFTDLSLCGCSQWQQQWVMYRLQDYLFEFQLKPYVNRLYCCIHSNPILFKWVYLLFSLLYFYFLRPWFQYFYISQCVLFQQCCRALIVFLYFY